MLAQPWYWRNARILSSLILTGSRGWVGVAPQKNGSGLIATYIAIMLMMVALISLAFGKRPSKLEIVSLLIIFGGVIFWCRARVLASL